MKKKKQLGIWMDHSTAYIMEFTTKPFEIQTIVNEIPLKCDSNERYSKEILKKSINKYYHRIADAIVHYNHVILFGPAKTKVDFFDILSEDPRFLKMTVEIKETDKMNVTEQHAFISEYFLNT